MLTERREKRPGPRGTRTVTDRREDKQRCSLRPARPLCRGRRVSARLAGRAEACRGRLHDNAGSLSGMQRDRRKSRFCVSWFVSDGAVNLFRLTADEFF